MPKQSVKILVFPLLFFFLFPSPPFLSFPLSYLLLCSSPEILRSHIITLAHTIREGTLPLPSVVPQIRKAGTKPHCFLSLSSLCLVIPRQGHGRAWQREPFGQRLKVVSGNQKVPGRHGEEGTGQRNPNIHPQTVYARI